jgi:Bacterial Ig-like domain (group 3)/FG-GAP-like repeat/FG-GAP repeat
MVRRQLLGVFFLFCITLPGNAQTNGISTATVTLNASPGSAAYGTPNTFSAVVDPTQVTSAPTGSVTFMDGTATLGTGNLKPFLGGPIVTTGTQPNGGALFADVNNDGKPDLIGILSTVLTSPTPSTTIEVELGVGDGTFKPPIQSTTPPHYLTLGSVADVDGDGKPDLVIVDNSSNSLDYLPGNGDGTFGSPVVVYSDTNPLTLASVQVADMNGDKVPDIIATDGSRPAGTFGITNVLVFINQGKGMFASPEIDSGWDSAANGQPESLSVADLNNDGYPDLIISADTSSDLAGGESYQVYVLLNQGNGTFGEVQQVATNGWIPTVVVNDFNGDKIPDLGILEASTTSFGFYDLSILQGKGDGTFGAPAITQLIPGPLSAFPEIQGLFAGDVNGDGKVDLVTGAYIFAGNGDGTFATPYAFYDARFTSSMNVQLIGVDDINGDGIDDIGVITGIQGVDFYGFNNLNIFLGMRGAQATLTTAALTGGSHSITAAYSGDNQFAPATSNPVAVDISQQTTMTALPSVSPNPAVAGQSVVFQVQVASSQSAPALPTGSVAFQNGSTVLGTAMLDGNGNASFTSSFPSQGNETVTASYTGDINYAGSSTSVVEAILPAYLLSASGSSTVTVASGKSGTLTLSLTPQNSFSGTVTLTCGNLPADASCSFSPSSGVAISGTTAQSTTLTISTSATTAAVRDPFAILNIFPAGALLMIGFMPRKNRKARHSLLLFMTLCFAVTMVTACGGGNHSTSNPGTPGTPTGTYTITVNTTSGTIQQSMPITLVVN